MTNHRKILELSVNEQLNVLKSHKKAVLAPIPAGKNDKKKTSRRRMSAGSLYGCDRIRSYACMALSALVNSLFWCAAQFLWMMPLAAATSIFLHATL